MQREVENKTSIARPWERVDVIRTEGGATGTDASEAATEGLFVTPAIKCAGHM